MINFKACPRCRGDLYLTRDYYGEYRECLQCGYIKDMEDASFKAVGLREALEKVSSEAA